MAFSENTATASRRLSEGRRAMTFLFMISRMSILKLMALKI